MEKVLISAYKNVHDSNDQDVALDSFLNGIKSGAWQDQVLKVRTIHDKKERAAEKQKCPLVTISGSFQERKDAAIRKHSGFIAIDIDNIENANTTKEILSHDAYIFAAFVSISGNGLCCLFKIDGTRHADAFESIAAYLYETYQIIVDQSGKNVSRARFVSFDPFIHINEKAITFKKYLPKPKPKKIQRTVFVKSDFDLIINQFNERQINLCEEYSEWVSIAYSLISQFGENGREYFHVLSSISSKYNAPDTDKQYDSCLKNSSESKAKLSTIGTIYHLAKINGIDTYSAQTKEIIRSAASQKAAGVKPDQIKKTLKEFAGIDEADSEEIIKQVLEKDIKHKSENIVDDIVAFLRPYKIRKNLLSRNVELNGKPIDDSDINSLYLDSKVAFKDASKDLVCSILFSNRIDSYNPAVDFFTQREILPPDELLPNLALLLNSIQTDTENYDTWVTKWLVSVVASAFGKHSPLVLVFCGEVQGTGKTHWFRYLLPQQLQPLFAESKMDAGKDDEILMTKKLIILDDEYGGKSKREEKRLKEITSKAWINVREPYGRVSVDLRRLSVFCGTSNETQILNDPTGNRRIIPIHINCINHDLYNQCNKTELWHEVYSLYMAGFDYSILKHEISQLNDNTEAFKQSSIEEELIYDRISVGSEMNGEWMSITAIIQYLIADSKIHTLSNQKVGIILKKLNYPSKRIKKDGAVITVYLVRKGFGAAF
jgi:predicted P-loop ATPase